MGAKNSFLVELQADDIHEFKDMVKEYALIRWGHHLDFAVPKTDVRRKYIDIETVCCQYYHVTLSQLFERTVDGRLKRKPDVVKARHFISFIMYNQNYSSVEIGEKLYDGDHTCALYAVEVTKENITKKPSYRHDFEKLCELLKINYGREYVN